MTDTQSAPSPALMAAYQAAFDYFNRVLFGGKLDHVVLNFSRHAKALGFFAPERWGTDKDEGRDRVAEISLNPTYLATFPMVETYSTLVHEMVHALEYQEGRRGRPGYHSKTWAANMDEVGLTPSSTGLPGGKRTGDKMSHYRVPGGAYEQAFAALPDDAKLPLLCVDQFVVKDPKKKAKNKIKYTCEGCQTNVWGKPEIRVMCDTCGTLFEAEKTDEEGNDDDEE